MITKAQIQSLAGSKFFHIKFVKADGSIRDMNCRLGVQKHLKGIGRHEDAENVLTVYDMQNGYRSIRVDRVLSVDCGGFHIEQEAGSCDE